MSLAYSVHKLLVSIMIHEITQGKQGVVPESNYRITGKYGGYIAYPG